MIDFAAIGIFIRDYGLPLTALLIVLWTGARKVWIWGYRLGEEQAHHDEVVAQRDKSYDEMQQLWRERYEEKVAEAKKWESYALKSTLAAVQVGRAAVEREDEKTR